MQKLIAAVGFLMLLAPAQAEDFAFNREHSLGCPTPQAVNEANELLATPLKDRALAISGCKAIIANTKVAVVQNIGHYKQLLVVDASGRVERFWGFADSFKTIFEFAIEDCHARRDMSNECYDREAERMRGK